MLTLCFLAICIIEIVTAVHDLSAINSYWKAWLIGPSIEALTLVRTSKREYYFFSCLFFFDIALLELPCLRFTIASGLINVLNVKCVLCD